MTLYKLAPSFLLPKTHILWAGTSLLGAGYCLYSSSTVLVLTLGNGVNGFTYDSNVGEFILSHPNVQIPDKGAIYSFNEGNYDVRWGPVRLHYQTAAACVSEFARCDAAVVIGSGAMDTDAAGGRAGRTGVPQPCWCAAGLDGGPEEVHGQPEDEGQHQREGVLIPLHRQPGALYPPEDVFAKSCLEHAAACLLPVPAAHCALQTAGRCTPAWTACPHMSLQTGRSLLRPAAARWATSTARCCTAASTATRAT